MRMVTMKMSDLLRAMGRLREASSKARVARAAATSPVATPQPAKLTDLYRG